jgi:hypothetical protein
MAAKKQRKKPGSPAQSRSSFRPVIINAVFNMAATAATFGAVLLCLILAKHFT